VSDRTYAPDAESTAGFPRAALPDDPDLEMRLSRTEGSDDPLPPNSAALFPEIPTWTDDQLIIAIERKADNHSGTNQRRTKRHHSSARDHCLHGGSAFWYVGLIRRQSKAVRREE
jgi:hypothetical protein